MTTFANNQSLLFPNAVAEFPSTRYQGSKAKLADWIWRQIADLDFTSCLDAFGGTGAVAYRLKQAGKKVTYNDVLRFNYHTGQALIENKDTMLENHEVEWLLQRHREIPYPDFVQKTFSDIYFTNEENAWIDQTITNIRMFTNPLKFALAFFALCQSCIVKRPYNLFHRKNLYMRLAEVKRSFGNKASWDRPFEEWFRVFAKEANLAVFDNGQNNRALHYDALDVPGHYDLVYVDTPYVSRRGVAVDYLAFYHFLEGLADYEHWGERLDTKSKHRRLKPLPNPWADRKAIRQAFNRLFQRYADSLLVVSYRTDGSPSESELRDLLGRYKRNVRVEHYGQYKYVLSVNGQSGEMLLIGT